ncbi:MAG: hypothetical protein GXO23_02870 [Crenarchaeota archaeon]|nr:hypothetical protein [Thermoproteota archaeon]
MNIRRRGLSEILAAALLALIAAIFGFIIFYYAVNIYSATLRATTRVHCDFTIVDVAINTTSQYVELIPLIYVTSRVPCNISEEYVVINGSVMKDATMLVDTVKPYNVTALPPLVLSPSIYDKGRTVEVVVVSSDGIIKRFIVKGR